MQTRSLSTRKSLSWLLDCGMWQCAAAVSALCGPRSKGTKLDKSPEAVARRAAAKQLRMEKEARGMVRHMPCVLLFLLLVVSLTCWLLLSVTLVCYTLYAASFPPSQLHEQVAQFGLVQVHFALAKSSAKDFECLFALSQPRRSGSGNVKLGAGMKLSRKDLAELSQFMPDPKSDDLFDPGAAAHCQATHPCPSSLAKSFSWSYFSLTDTAVERMSWSHAWTTQVNASALKQVAPAQGSVTVHSGSLMSSREVYGHIGVSARSHAVEECKVRNCQG